jgi:hypothetical protein
VADRLSASEAIEMAKSLLIISRQAPWNGPSAREALDIALAGGAFDLPLGMLFLDDGVFQLAPDQHPPPCNRRTWPPTCRRCRCSASKNCSPATTAWPAAAWQHHAGAAGASAR